MNELKVPKKPKKPTSLLLLFASDIQETKFDVPGSFSELRVLRCAEKDDTSTLFVAGSSTYNDVRLDNAGGEAQQPREEGPLSAAD